VPSRTRQSDHFPSSKCPSQDELVDVGEVVGVFGLKGQIKIRPSTSFAERFDPQRELWIGDKPFVIRESHWKQLQVRLTLVGIDTVEAAELLIGEPVRAIRADHPELDPDEYYTADLLGLAVFDEAGATIGTIEEVVPSPAHDLIRIGDLLIPAVHEFVRKIDLEQRQMTVRLLPGMETEPGDTR